MHHINYRSLNRVGLTHFVVSSCLPFILSFLDDSILLTLGQFVEVNRLIATRAAALQTLQLGWHNEVTVVIAVVPV